MLHLRYRHSLAKMSFSQTATKRGASIQLSLKQEMFPAPEIMPWFLWYI